MTDIPKYTGQQPSHRGQSQTQFDANAENILAWIVSLPTPITNIVSEVIALADARNYDPASIYNVTGYTRPSFVYGSDGITYVCIGSNVTGDNPVGSITGVWVAVTLRAEDTLQLEEAAPVGSILAMALATPPTGWLEADGSAISRTTYAALFAALSTVYGAGDGATTFNLPDYRGRFLRGWAHGQTTDPDKATRTDRGDGTTGDAVGTKQGSQNLAHTHSITYASLTDGAAYPGTRDTSNLYPKNTGSSGGSESRPININVMYCIKY